MKGGETTRTRYLHSAGDQTGRARAWSMEHGEGGTQGPNHQKPQSPRQESFNPLLPFELLQSARAGPREDG